MSKMGVLVSPCMQDQPGEYIFLIYFSVTQFSLCKATAYLYVCLCMCVYACMCVFVFTGYLINFNYNSNWLKGQGQTHDSPHDYYIVCTSNTQWHLHRNLRPILEWSDIPTPLKRCYLCASLISKFPQLVLDWWTLPKQNLSRSAMSEQKAIKTVSNWLLWLLDAKIKHKKTQCFDPN